MSAITPEGLESSLTSDDSTVSEIVESFVESTTKLAESLDAPEKRVSDFKQSGEDLAQLVEGIAQESAQTDERTRENSERLDEVETRSQHTFEDTCKLETRMDEVEEQLSADEPHTSSRQDPSPADSLTPVEQLSTAEDDADQITDSASAQRAVSLFENLPEWGTKTPKGIVLKPADNPLSLLEADRDESLCWKQYYRASKALERLSKGSITFVESDRHGKMLILHEQSEMYDRIKSGSLTTSSAEAST